MKAVKDLISQLQNPGFLEKYPQVSVYDKMVHVLYLRPYLNGTGLHRAIAPTLHLNQTSTHRAAIAQFENWNMAGQSLLDEHTIELTDHLRQLISWAHYMVLPMYVHDIGPMLDDFRGINPSLQFVMDVDDFIYEMPPAHPAHGKYTKETKVQFTKNLQKMQVVTGSTNYLLEQLEPIIGPGPDLFHIPNLMSRFFGEHISWPDPQTPPKALITPNPGQWADINPLKKILAPLVKNNEIELILFGWNGTNRNMNSCVSGIKHTYVPPVPVTEYFSKMASLGASCALMPLQDNVFNRCKSHHKLLHYAMLGIPTVVSNLSTYTDFIFQPHEINPIGKIRAIVAKSNAEWAPAIKEATSGAIAHEIVSTNKDLVWQENSLETELYYLTNCFIE